MTTKYHNPAESQSAHAVKDGTLIATPAALAFIVSVFAEISPEQRKRIATAINLAGNKSMSQLPQFLQPIILYGLTQDYAEPWGYHPYHATPGAVIPLIADLSVDVERRFELATVMLKHGDSSIREWSKLESLKAGFTPTQLTALGLKAPEVVAPVNTPQPENLLAKLAAKLGVTVEDAMAFLNEDTEPAQVTPVTNQPKAKPKAKRSLTELPPSDAK